jgi:hypothetical protein
MRTWERAVIWKPGRQTSKAQLWRQLDLEYPGSRSMGKFISVV